MALKNKMKFDLLVDPDDPTVLILQPVGEELQNGFKYTVNIKDIQFEDSTVYSNKESFITTPNNYYYVSVEDVQDLIHGLNLDEENIMHHIIDAGKTAVYWAKRNVDDFKTLPDFNSPTFQEDYYPFYMFVKYRAAVETLKAFYIGAVTRPKKIHDVLSDLERLEEYDLDAIRKLLDLLEEEAEHWVGHVATITADPEWALRGKYSYAIAPPSSIHYHNTYIDKKGGGNGWNRGY